MTRDDAPTSGDYESQIEGQRRQIIALREALFWFITRYDTDNPIRTADVHKPYCNCMRCARDYAHKLMSPK